MQDRDRHTRETLAIAAVKARGVLPQTWPEERFSPVTSCLMQTNDALPSAAIPKTLSTARTKTLMALHPHLSRHFEAAQFLRLPKSRERLAPTRFGKELRMVRSRNSAYGYEEAALCAEPQSHFGQP